MTSCRRMKLGLSLAVVVLLALGLWAIKGRGDTTAGESRGVPAVAQGRRVVIISADGLRPDVLLRGSAPNIRAMMRDGSFTFYAETTDVALTLPSHVSMLTGVPPETHQIDWNYERSSTRPTYPATPTIFELAKRQGLTTAMAVGKEKLGVLAKPETVDWSFIPVDAKTEGEAVATEVAEHAAKIIREHAPNLLFVHLPDPDNVGHDKGWGTDEQVRSVAKVDLAVATITTALREKGLMDSTVIIFTSDHGGSGWSHGSGDPRSQYIPWIISGPGIEKNHDLTSHYYLTVKTYDTFATACYTLGIPRRQGGEGNVVAAAFVNPPTAELLKDTPSDAATRP